VIAEVMAEIKNCEQTIADAESAETAAETEVMKAQTNLAEATVGVEEAKKNEEIALGRLRDLKVTKAEAARKAQAAEDDKVETAKKLKILELEFEGRDQKVQLEEAKRKAQEAQEAAKKMLEESKRKEKEAADALKASRAEQAAKEAQALQEHAEADKSGAAARKDKKAADKAAEKEMQLEMKHIDSARLQRDKERQQKLREAMGKGRGKGLKALTDGSSPAKRGAPLPVAETAPEKVARVGTAGDDVD